MYKYVNQVRSLRSLSQQVWHGGVQEVQQRWRLPQHLAVFATARHPQTRLCVRGRPGKVRNQDHHVRKWPQGCLAKQVWAILHRWKYVATFRRPVMCFPLPHLNKANVFFFLVLVNSGSRHEAKYPSGIAHFLEKLAFSVSTFLLFWYRMLMNETITLKNKFIYFSFFFFFLL